jgi:hypothetical protein
MWTRCCVTVAVLLSLSVSVAGQPTPARRIDILERGTYRAETLARIPTPGTTGVINTVRNARLISSSTSIPGALGVRFCLRYLLRGQSAALVHLRLVIVFPPGGLRNPTTGQTFFTSEHTVSVSAVASFYWEYHFENQWENRARSLAVRVLGRANQARGAAVLRIRLGRKRRVIKPFAGMQFSSARLIAAGGT